MSDIEVKGKIVVDTGDTAAKVDNVKNKLNEAGSAGRGTTGSFSNLKKELGGVAQGMAMGGTQAGLLNGALNLLRANPVTGIFILLAGLVLALVNHFRKMEGVSDALGKAWASLSGLLETFMNYVLTPLIDGFVTLIGWITDAAEWLVGQFSPSLAEASRRSGELAEQLDALEDAERNSAIARAESNRRLQEARELAADANVPIKDRIAALKEAGRIEEEETRRSIEIAQTRARIMTEQLAIELGVRQELIKQIKEGNIEALKAARNEIAAMKNVDMEKIKSIDEMIIKAEDEAAALAKINKKTSSQIAAIENEERERRQRLADEAKRKREEQAREREKERQQKQKALEEELANDRKAALERIKIADEERIAREKREQEEQQAKERRLQADIARQNAGIASAQASMDRMNQNTANQLAYEEAVTAQRITLRQQVANAIGALADLVGRQTALGKTLAIAEIALGTATGFIQGLDIAQKSAKGTGPAAAFAFPIFYATQIAAVLAAAGRAKAALAKAPGGSGGGGSLNISAPTVAAPLNPAPVSQATSLDANTINNIGNAASGGISRAFVLDSDINSNSERNARIKRAATLG